MKKRKEKPVLSRRLMIVDEKVSIEARGKKSYFIRSA